MRYLRNRPDKGDNYRAAVIASATAAAVGLISFYFTRLMLAREPLGTEVEARSDEPQSGAS